MEENIDRGRYRYRDRNRKKTDDTATRFGKKRDKEKQGRKR